MNDTHHLSKVSSRLGQLVVLLYVLQELTVPNVICDFAVVCEHEELPRRFDINCTWDALADKIAADEWASGRADELGLAVVQRNGRD